MKTIKDIDINNKTVLIRCDLNVPPFCKSYIPEQQLKKQRNIKLKEFQQHHQQ